MTLEEALDGATCSFETTKLNPWANSWTLNSRIFGHSLSGNIKTLEEFYKKGGWYKITNINLDKFNIWLEEQYGSHP